MENTHLQAGSNPLEPGDIFPALEGALKSAGKLSRVLIVPPDITRFYSCAGLITGVLVRLLQDARVDILPALGTHMPMTKEEIERMYPGIPKESFLTHSWRHGVSRIGTIPGEYVEVVSAGAFRRDIDVKISRYITEGAYDLVISVGQIVPHEVAGMSGYTKNIFVGCGGEEMIHMSHYIGALHGIERIMGTMENPVRRVFNYGEDHFLKDLPILHVMTVVTRVGETQRLEGLSIGTGRDLYGKTCELSLEKNVTRCGKKLKKIVVYLDPGEFRSTWLGNKGIYRTRPVIADGGELVIIAPGLHTFGEDETNDTFIRKYGYRGTDGIRKIAAADTELGRNLSAAAHLIHGSPDGRFRVIYAPGHMSREEIESVGYSYMNPEESLRRYNPKELHPGMNTVRGEDVFFIDNPALGLWMV